MSRNPGMRVTDVVKQIAKLWQDLPNNIKGKFKEEARLGKIPTLFFLQMLSQTKKGIRENFTPSRKG